MKVLIVEDGHEYLENLQQFLPDGFVWQRVGSGPQALAWLEENEAVAIFLDMRFDRAPAGELLGDLAEAADRFNGDPVQARRFLEDHQGNYVLAALRQAGFKTPVLMSYDFDAEPKRWARIAGKFGPVDYLPDNASPADIADRLRALAG